VLGDEKPKYLNSPETPVFHKGRELYGLFEARQALREAGYVLVTEGYMDVVALAQLGFPNAVATLGTACTPEHVQKLFRFTDSVVFAFDGDAAGRRAARKALDGALPHASDVRTVKFLFLPPEHDPDSYIRDFGADAFARCVGEATPLSRFLVEAAGEGCDLTSAEGRARLASNARPLWSALPEGALKRQLLGELAALVQLTARELAEVWTDRPAASPASGSPTSKYQDDSNRRPFGAGEWQRSTRNANSAVRPAGRAQPASRADHAARLLLARMDLWDGLSHEDHEMLCALPSPHGPLFVWLDHQFHDHGALAWGALRDEIAGREFEALALRLMNNSLSVAPNAASPDDPGETRRELWDVITRMHLDQVEAMKNQMAALASKDAGARERFQALNARQIELKASLSRS
jgi:DNA primase